MASLNVENRKSILELFWKSQYVGNGETCSTQTVNQITKVQSCHHKNIRFDRNYYPYMPIDQFRYIKIQPETIDLSTKLREITTEFVGFISQSLVLRSIVLCRTSIYRNWAIDIVVWAFTLRNSDILKTHKVLMKRTNSPQSPIAFFSFSNLAFYLSRDLDVYSLFIPLVQCQIVFVLLLFIY